MRHLSLLALSLALCACGDEPGADLGQDLSCEFDPHDWYDNAFASVLQGEAGVFDIDPIGDAVVQRTGSYDFETGDYDYVSTYADEHPYITVTGQGYGTVYDNGDLDLITKTVYSDVLGETWADQLRTERTGCTGSVRRTEHDLDAPVDAQPESWADSYEWATTIVSDIQVDYHMEAEREYGLYVSDSSISPDYASQGSFDYADGGYAGTTVMLWDGSGTSTWEQYGAAFGDDYDFIGDDEYFLNGSRLSAYGVFAGGSSSLEAEVELLWLYDESATGSYVIHDGGSTITCDVTITEGRESCTMYCPGYGTYDC
jgi:hypothetical protein